uniref:Branched-chain-amino-acid aminotransferase n=1 Tax=uncultured gamma proteobacterium HF0010_20H22 TaxID=723562 RepID=E7C1R3_9GAMM|nr:branched-chain amino acid aminotransferase/4-amino-4-deoxychorismate lyase [uncultured gamma proteobacterium HF0010_20H22]
MTSLAEKKGFIWFDGKIVHSNEANVHVLTHTLHYGLGVFEGVRAYETSEGTKIFRLNDHTERLFSSANSVDLEIPYSIDEINKAQVEIVKINKLKEAYIRPMCFYGSGSLGLRADDLKVHTIVAAWEWPSYMAPEVFEKGIKVKISSYKRERGNLVSRSKVNGNYVKSMMALKEALKEGYDEALLLDTENYISEGSGENLFAVKNEELFTPSLDASLDGITRKSIISLAEELGIKVNVKDLSESDITSSDELFFTGTAAEVVPITQVNNLKIGSGKRGKVTEVLQKNYFDQVRGKRSSFPEWHTLVD